MCSKPETLYQVLGQTCNTFNEQEMARNAKDALYYLHPDKRLCSNSSDTVNFRREMVFLAYKVLRDTHLRDKYNALMCRDYRGNSLSNIKEKDFLALRKFEKKIETVIDIKIKKAKRKQNPFTHMRGPASNFVLHMGSNHYAG